MATVLSKTTVSRSRSALSQGEGGATSKIPTLPDQVAKDLVQLFKLLADETRLRILYYLMRCDELNVRALCGLLKQSQPAVSHHLALLRVAGLIQCRRDGKHNFYRLLPKKFEQLMGMIFAASPDEAGIRFEDYVLQFTHADGGK